MCEKFRIMNLNEGPHKCHHFYVLTDYLPVPQSMMHHLVEGLKKEKQRQRERKTERKDESYERGHLQPRNQYISKCVDK